MFFILLFVVLALFTALTAGYLQAETALKTDKEDDGLTASKWWAKKRWKYNLGLMIAGVVAFLAYAVLGNILIAPYDEGFEITLFTIVFQGIGYLIMMLVANLFYSLGAFVDNRYNKQNSLVFRTRLFNLRFIFSVTLPFAIPILVIVEYFIRFAVPTANT